MVAVGIQNISLSLMFLSVCKRLCSVLNVPNEEKGVIYWWRLNLKTVRMSLSPLFQCLERSVCSSAW